MAEDLGARFEAWRQALGELTGSEESARAWRHHRYKFAYELGHALVGDRRSPRVSGHVVYGVWLRWGLLYVGQTTEAERRLRDLAIGESHHLANTFPPELWDQVLVISWPDLPEAQSVPAELEPHTVGLALEHRLHAWLQPLANDTRRTDGGGWRKVNWATSRSRGAKASHQVGELFQAVQGIWRAAEGRRDTVRLPSSAQLTYPQDLLST